MPLERRLNPIPQSALCLGNTPRSVGTGVSVAEPRSPAWEGRVGILLLASWVAPSIIPHFTILSSA
jgi:hypothetical protein